MKLFGKKSTKDMVQGGTSAAKPEKPAKERKPRKEPRPVGSLLGLAKSRTAIGILCLLLAAVVGLVVLPGVYRSQAATEPVVTLALDVPAGTVLTSEMLSTTEVGAYGLPAGVVRDMKDAIGMVATEGLYAGEYLWSSRIQDSDSYHTLNADKTRGLSAGLCLVTIEPPSVSTVVGGVLRAGSIVDVYECAEDSETEDYQIEKRLSAIHIYQVLNSDFESLDDLDEAPVISGTRTDFKPAYVVIRCTRREAEELIRLEKEKSLHMVLTGTGVER